MRPMRDYERILRCGWADVLMENITFTSHLFILKVRYLPVGKVPRYALWLGSVQQSTQDRVDRCMVSRVNIL